MNPELEMIRAKIFRCAIAHSEVRAEGAPRNDDLFRTRASSARPATKNMTSTAMPAFWLAVMAVMAPISSGPTKDVTFPVSANSPKYCATRSFGAIRTSSERDAACSGPPAMPIRQPSSR